MDNRNSGSAGEKRTLPSFGDIDIKICNGESIKLRRLQVNMIDIKPIIAKCNLDVERWLSSTIVAKSGLNSGREGCCDSSESRLTTQPHEKHIDQVDCPDKNVHCPDVGPSFVEAESNCGLRNREFIKKPRRISVDIGVVDFEKTLSEETASDAVNEDSTAGSCRFLDVLRDRLKDVGVEENNNIPTGLTILQSPIYDSAAECVSLSSSDFTRESVASGENVGADSEAEREISDFANNNNNQKRKQPELDAHEQSLNAQKKSKKACDDYFDSILPGVTNVNLGHDADNLEAFTLTPHIDINSSDISKNGIGEEEEAVDMDLSLEARSEPDVSLLAASGGSDKQKVCDFGGSDKFDVKKKGKSKTRPLNQDFTKSIRLARASRETKDREHFVAEDVSSTEVNRCTKPRCSIRNISTERSGPGGSLCLRPSRHRCRAVKEDSDVAQANDVETETLNDLDQRLRLPQRDVQKSGQTEITNHVTNVETDGTIDTGLIDRTTVSVNGDAGNNSKVRNNTVSEENIEAEIDFSDEGLTDCDDSLRSAALDVESDGGLGSDSGCSNSTNRKVGETTIVDENKDATDFNVKDMADEFVDTRADVEVIDAHLDSRINENSGKMKKIHSETKQWNADIVCKEAEASSSINGNVKSQKCKKRLGSGDKTRSEKELKKTCCSIRSISAENSGAGGSLRLRPSRHKYRAVKEDSDVAQANDVETDTVNDLDQRLGLPQRDVWKSGPSKITSHVTSVDTDPMNHQDDPAEECRVVVLETNSQTEPSSLKKNRRMKIYHESLLTNSVRNSRLNSDKCALSNGPEYVQQTPPNPQVSDEQTTPNQRASGNSTSKSAARNIPRFRSSRNSSSGLQSVTNVPSDSEPESVNRQQTSNNNAQRNSFGGNRRKSHNDSGNFETSTPSVAKKRNISRDSQSNAAKSEHNISSKKRNISRNSQSNAAKSEHNISSKKRNISRNSQSNAAKSERSVSSSSVQQGSEQLTAEKGNSRLRPTQCRICMQSFEHTDAWLRHMDTHADMRGTHYCRLCKKWFSSADIAKRHSRTHDKGQYVACEFCGKRFSRADVLRVHVRTHTNEKPYKCDACDKRFATSTHLRLHQPIHSGVKKYSCSVCHQRFSQTPSLRRHMRRHTGERPHQCKVCQRSFITSTCLHLHMLRHQSRRPLECDICHQRFYQRNHLTTHRRTHTGERPFGCDACQKRFTRADGLRRHRRLVHKVPHDRSWWQPGDVTHQRSGRRPKKPTMRDVRPKKLTKNDSQPEKPTKHDPRPEKSAMGVALPDKPTKGDARLKKQITRDSKHEKSTEQSQPKKSTKHDSRPERSNVCSLCGFNFSRIDGLKRHLQNVHKQT